MEFVSEKEYMDAINRVKDYEKREQKIVQFKSELGRRLEEFDKFKFKIKDNRVIFAGYFVDKNDNDHLVISEAICSSDDKFNKLLGKLIAVRKALGLNINDIVDIVEPIKKSDIITFCSGNGEAFSLACDILAKNINNKLKQRSVW